MVLVAELAAANFEQDMNLFFCEPRSKAPHCAKAVEVVSRARLIQAVTQNHAYLEGRANPRESGNDTPRELT
jgi:hypothetical protein